MEDVPSAQEKKEDFLEIPTSKEKPAETSERGKPKALRKQRRAIFIGVFEAKQVNSGGNNFMQQARIRSGGRMLCY
jgi:hypothetical protein